VNCVVVAISTAAMTSSTMGTVIERRVTGSLGRDFGDEHIAFVADGADQVLGAGPG